MLDIDRLVAETLNVAPGALVDSLQYQDIPEWDSVGHLNLMLALEEALGVAIPDDTVVELTTMEALRAFATKHGSG
ncbi:MAG TPA: acyl carrier protein [Gemmatimonadaceae bacterium]|nr:acyl carrier protein [Gemmatimonadaceae bacterium]